MAQRVSVVVDFSHLPRHQKSVWIRIDAMADMYPGASTLFFLLSGCSFVFEQLKYASIPRPLPPSHPAVDINGYIPPYEDPVTTVPLDPNFLAYIYFEDHEEGEEERPALPPGTVPRSNNGVPHPDYTAPIPAPPHALPAAETNMIDARPLDHLVAPEPTHNMYLEIEFASDDEGEGAAVGGS